MRPEKYSVPFCFRNNKIEYCLGFQLAADVCTFVFSENDTSPGMIRVPLAHLRFLDC
jgi:predicted ATP-grasp superfamily ATP-dependent carboligase